jgi:hypothetical protein
MLAPSCCVFVFVFVFVLLSMIYHRIIAIADFCTFAPSHARHLPQRVLLLMKMQKWHFMVPFHLRR